MRAFLRSMKGRYHHNHKQQLSITFTNAAVNCFHYLNDLNLPRPITTNQAAYLSLYVYMCERQEKRDKHLSVYLPHITLSSPVNLDELTMCLRKSRGDEHKI